MRSSRVADAARRRLKGALEALIFRGGPARIGREMHRGRTIVLAYHNIVPTGEPVRGDRSLHLPLATFEEQLDLLLETHDIVPLEAALPEQRGPGATAGRVTGSTWGPDGGAERPRAVITFDDAYRGAVRAGVPALVKRGLPATIFVAPHFVDGGSFWWDCAPEAEMADSFRELALHELEGRDETIRKWMHTRGWQTNDLPEHQTAASVVELQAATKEPTISVASHSWSHASLVRLSPMELEEELARPHEWLRERFARVLPWISYPYGLSSPAVESAARRAGYRGGLRISGGWLPTRIENAFALPRLNVPSRLSIEGFGARGAGLLCR